LASTASKSSANARLAETSNNTLRKYFIRNSCLSVTTIWCVSIKDYKETGYTLRGLPEMIQDFTNQINPIPEFMSYTIESIPPIQTWLVLTHTGFMKNLSQLYLELAIDCI
jgi:hypothetical protein